MKFIHYVEKIARVDVYGIASFMIFFIFFSIMLGWVFRTKKQRFNEISRIPLDNQ